MKWFKNKKSKNEQYTYRQGDLVATDEVFRAWTSGDLFTAVLEIMPKWNL